jgi:hypothetical protein
MTINGRLHLLFLKCQKFAGLNLLSAIVPLKADIFAVSIEKYRFLDVYYLKTALDLNNINYLCLAPYSSK